MNLRRKLQASLAGLLLIEGASGAYLVRASRQLHSLNLQLLDDAPSADAADLIELEIQRVDRLEGFDSAPKAIDAEEAARRRVAEALTKLEAIRHGARSGEEHALVATLREDLVRLSPAAPSRELLDQAVADAAKLSEFNREELAETTTASERLSEEAETAAGILLVAGLLVAALVFETLWRSISLPLGRLSAAVRKIESGDVRVRVGFTQNDEMGMLGRAFDGMLDTAERREADKAAFIAGVAHDLRTPLATISLGLESLRRALTDPQLEKRAQMLERQVGRLDRLLQELLDVARVAAGNANAKVENIALHQLAEDAFALFRDTSPQHRFSLETKPVWVRADPDLMMRVVVNLLSNAVKYSPDGGPIAVTVSIDGDFAELSVRDAGIGVSENERGKVFERFARVDPNANIPGTGLGLYLARRIVAQHGGILDFESTHGAGSRFFVRLPRISAPAVLGPASPDFTH